VTLSVLMTAGYWEEVPMHFRAAIANGLTREEIREVILQAGSTVECPWRTTAPPS
jgi:4-carboxymuconolactone decarboxylase